jgi:hypothetical protein
MSLALCLCLLAGPGRAAASSLDLYYERAIMSAVDAKCGLFEPPVASALNVAKFQAQQRSLAGGDRRRRASQDFSESPSQGLRHLLFVSGPRDRCRAVRSAFDSYARMLKMDYPGDIVGWKANRGSSNLAFRWRLTQDVTQNGDRLLFGLAGRTGANALLALAHFKNGQRTMRPVWLSATTS